MKICTSFRQPGSVQEKMQQIRYPITSLNNVLERLQTDYSTDYIVEIFDLDNTDLTAVKIHSLAVDFSNLFFDFHKFDDFKLIASQCDERKYMYHFPVNTYMDVQYLLQYPGLACITIEEPLTFDLDNIHKVIKEDEERDIQIRVYPTIGRPSRYRDYKKDNGINHFWILPQHLNLYEEFIDIIDLSDRSQKREHALCKIYTSNIPYLFTIQPLFKYVDSNVIGAFVDEEWATRRLNCKQTCLQKGVHCMMCLRQDRLYNSILEHPEQYERFVKHPISIKDAPTDPDLEATD